jgi:nicotinate-nucleotide pyrophosphorylase (carboxylating)
MAKTTITKRELKKFIKAALYEDVQNGDITSLACIPAESRSRAKLLCKADGIVAGLRFAEEVFAFCDPSYSIEFFKKEGDPIQFGDIAFIVECNTRALLQAERLVLNTMQRMSGIATLSTAFSKAVEGLPVKILDTRKTTPLFRMIEKWAVRIGGCHNYRDGLYDRFMPKDNHVDACGGVQQAIESILQYKKEHNITLPTTVEVRTLDDLRIVLEVGGVERVMLDNMPIPMMAEAVKIVNKRIEVEASGGVTLATVRAIAETGVDFISTGAITHSAQSLDLSLKVIKS